MDAALIAIGARDLVRLHMEGYEEYLHDKDLLERHRSASARSK